MTIILMVMMVMVVMMVMMVAMAMTRTWLPFISNLKTRGPTVTVKWRLGGRSHLKHGQPVATIAQSKNWYIMILCCHHATQKSHQDYQDLQKRCWFFQCRLVGIIPISSAPIHCWWSHRSIPTPGGQHSRPSTAGSKGSYSAGHRADDSPRGSTRSTNRNQPDRLGNSRSSLTRSLSVKYNENHPWSSQFPQWSIWNHLEVEEIQPQTSGKIMRSGTSNQLLGADRPMAKCSTGQVSATVCGLFQHSKVHPPKFLTNPVVSLSWF